MKHCWYKKHWQRKMFKQLENMITVTVYTGFLCTLYVTGPAKTRHVDVLSCMRILPICVWDIPYMYIYSYWMPAYTHYGMPVCVWDDIFTEFLFCYKHLNLAQKSFIEVQTRQNCIILLNNKYFYRWLMYQHDIVLVFTI